MMSSMVVVSASDNNVTLMENDDLDNILVYDEVYVSSDGDDMHGNGSFDSPFSSIQYASSLANNNSRIILLDGVYKGESNTNIIIDKDLTIESLNDVTIDGENKNYFFKINKGSTLTLNNIKFINGYTSSYSQLGVINNQGKLLVNHSSFNSMKTIMSTFFNEGELIINDTQITGSYSQNMAQIITNIGYCTVSNSKLSDVGSSSSSLPTVYNYKNINIDNSQISCLFSNYDYDEFNYMGSVINIQNSILNTLELQNASCTIKNSQFNQRSSLKNVNLVIDASKFLASSGFTILSVFYSNMTATNSIFEQYISAGHSNINITYSAILDGLTGDGKKGYLYAPYNWWGINSGPSFSYFNNNSADIWAVATFDVVDGNLSVGTKSMFVTSFKWSDGNSTTDLNENESLPLRPIYFESQNGGFLYSSGSISQNFTNYLIGNTLDCNVYSIIDNQRLTLTIGNGLSEYTYFVAPWGNNGPDDGTLESPFKTIKYAISRAGNGNTICLLDGVYKNNANSEISVEKNITLVGLGDVTLSRANAKTMFYVKEWANLVIKNAKITIANDEYENNVFIVSGGNLTLINCSVYNVKSDAVIYTANGNENQARILIIDSSFSNIIGSVVSGSAFCYVDDSKFEKISNYYYWRGMEKYNSLFALTSAIEIYNSIFIENKMAIVNLHPYYYSSSGLLSASYSEYYETTSRYAYIENSTFINNVFSDLDNSYNSAGVGFNIYDSYGSFDGSIANCTFIGNKGKIAIAHNISGSSFINNSGQAYGGNPLVEAVSIDNSYFFNNLNQYKDGNGAFIGEGIASANMIINSTFINNRASFGGAVSNTKIIHYCVFVNNTAKYTGNDIFSNSGEVDYSTNWWGDNQKPTSDKIFIFLGTLKLDDWIIMSLESRSAHVIEASLNNVMDENGNIRKLEYNIPVRPVRFIVDGGNVTPELGYTISNSAYANITYEVNASDFKAYAKIDNQLLDVNVLNSNTRIIINDVVVKGKNNKFYVDLVNVNGHKISNQTLVVEIKSSDNQSQIFTIDCNDEGHASFDIDYPVGKYEVTVSFLGNGFFDKSEASAKIEVIISKTNIISYNHTYYGKNNIFTAILHDENGKNLVNFTVTFTITDSNGNSKTVNVQSDNYGRADIILSLDLGKYSVKSEFLGDSWNSPSSSKSYIEIKPADTVIYMSNSTLYGSGNVYDIILKDGHGNLIPGENINVKISQNNASDNFILRTDENGVAKLTVNYLPGIYDIKASYNGDKIYSPSQSSAIINVEKVLTVLSGFHYKVIPLNGIYSVVLTDMYGHRINNETVTLNCYAGKLLRTYVANTDANGEVSFEIDLDEGTYLITMDYAGSLWYGDSTGAATVVVSKDVALDSIYINSTDMVQYYGEDKYLQIEFNDPNAYSQFGKTIVVTMSSGSWSKAYNVVTDVFGLARLQIKLDPGQYNVTYKYSNPYYNIFGEGSNEITIYKMPTYIFANDLIMKSDENRIYEVILKDINNNPVKNMEVHMEINGENYDIATNDDGIAKLILNLNVGEYNITYSFNHPNYLSSYNQSRILVVDDEKSSTQLVSHDIKAYDNETINLTVALNDLLGNGIFSSEICLEIHTLDGELVKRMFSNTGKDGKAIFNFNLESGKYIAKLNYDGNNFYLASYNINTINIDSSDNRTRAILFKGESKIDKKQKYFVVLADENGISLSDKEIIFSVENNTYHSKTDSNGKAYLDLNLTPGKYSVKVFFQGDNYYRPVTAFVNLIVSGNLTQLYAQDLVKYYRNGTQFHALLLDRNDVPLINKVISVVLQNNTYNCTTDENGWITLNIDLKPGHYNVECYYWGEKLEENAYDNATIDVLMTVIGQDEVKYYGQTPYLSIQFFNGAGNPIKNTEFVIGVDGQNYLTKTDKDGIFNFNLNLNSGTHLISVTNPYDGLYVNYTLEIIPTIYTNTLVKVLGDNKVYSIHLIDNNGTNLSKQKVEVIINGVKYIKNTDARGNINLDMELDPKNYLVTVINPSTGEYLEKTIKVLHPISGNKDVTIYFGAKLTYKVRILEVGGKVAGQGKLVKFTINGKTYKVKTDKNGYATLKISNLKVNKYKLTINYNGHKVSNKITVKPVLTAKDISKKSKKVTFTAKLVNTKGKALSGKKITFKFKNKKYVAKTNSKGQAVIKLTLNPGKYTITSIYGKSIIKNKIVIKK